MGWRDRAARESLSNLNCCSCFLFFLLIMACAIPQMMWRASPSLTSFTVTASTGLWEATRIAGSGVAVGNNNTLISVVSQRVMWSDLPLEVCDYDPSAETKYTGDFRDPVEFFGNRYHLCGGKKPRNYFSALQGLAVTAAVLAFVSFALGVVASITEDDSVTLNFVRLNVFVSSIALVLVASVFSAYLASGYRRDVEDGVGYLLTYGFVGKDVYPTLFAMKLSVPLFFGPALSLWIVGFCACASALFVGFWVWFDLTRSLEEDENDLERELDEFGDPAVMVEV